MLTGSFPSDEFRGTGDQPTLLFAAICGHRVSSQCSRRVGYSAHRGAVSGLMLEYERKERQKTSSEVSPVTASHSLIQVGCQYLLCIPHDHILKMTHAFTILILAHVGMYLYSRRSWRAS